MRTVGLMRKLVIVPLALVVALLPAFFLTQAQAGSKYVVTMNVAKTTINEGQALSFSGKVSPKAAGQKVKIQQQSIVDGDVDWDTMTTATITTNGTYSKKFTPLSGRHKWRVYKSSSPGHAAGTSPAQTLSVFGWFKMANGTTQLEIASGTQYLGRYGSIDVAGTTVSRYFATNQLGGDTTRWYTKHLCKRIRVDVGLWDESAPGSVGQFRIFADSDRIASVRVPYGTSIAIEETFSRSGTGSIKFTGEAREPIVGPTAIVAANPRIQCAGMPTTD